MMNAIVTGATKGMGRAITLSLAQAGFNLAICSRNENEINSFCQELMSMYPTITAVGIATDCSKPADVRQFADFVQQHFALTDVLINNAGVYKPGSLLDEDDDNLESQYLVNFHAAYTLSKIFGRQMRQARSGHIINISSIAAKMPVVAAGSYSVTKAALLALTNILRLELMQHNVKVTAILPGSTLTSSWEGTTLPADRFIAAADIANAVMYSINSSAGANVDELIINPLAGII